MGDGGRSFSAWSSTSQQESGCGVCVLYAKVDLMKGVAMSTASRSIFEPALERAIRHALDYLDGLDARPVSATVTLNQLRGRLDRPLEVDGVEAPRVIDEIVADVDGGLLGSAGGRFFAWVIGGSLPAALAADWLTSTWDQNAALYACSPAEAVIEEVCGRWLKDLLRLPQSASFAVTTGCQMAHFTCLAAARNAVLARRGWDVER
jgi:glutamate/tyrosine decarboxylase-like PLP-dependent enzyme